MSSPLQAVTDPDPYPYYATLVAERPLYHDDELKLWVASGAEAVEQLLRSPACRVRPPGVPVPPGIAGSAAGEVFGGLVRMCDGESTPTAGARSSRRRPASIRPLCARSAQSTRARRWIDRL